MGASRDLVQAATPKGAKLSTATCFAIHVIPQLLWLVAMDLGVWSNHIAIRKWSLSAISFNLIIIDFVVEVRCSMS